MIYGIGVDIVEISRIRALREKRGRDFFDKCYTDGEEAYCTKKKNLDESLAARFAAKEAVMKALGTGWGSGVSFRNIEVVREGEGAPFIRLHGAALKLSQEKGVGSIHLSLSHCREYAVAQVVAEKV